MSDLNPPAPKGGAQDHVGDSPYPLSGMDVTPRAPNGAGDHVAPFGLPNHGWSTEPHPMVDRHDGNMDTHRGQPKPGSFPNPLTHRDGGLP